MKPYIIIIFFFALLLTSHSIQANSLNEVVKEARKQGQVLSAKTRQGMHEVRVVTPQGSVKTIRKPAAQNNRNQRQPETSYRQNYYQQPSNQQPQRSDDRRENQRSREPEFHRFERPSQSVRPANKPSTRPSRNHRPKPSRQPRRQPPRRSDDRDPD